MDKIMEQLTKIVDLLEDIRDMKKAEVVLDAQKIIAEQRGMTKE
tara:strand:- start:437 stop:568 length:132 start_codon:yes stop_codon:yes gene_type:complete